MKLSGQHQFSAPPEEVYERLRDPAALRRCMPGCERLDPISETRLEIAMAVPIPAVKGRYEGTVEFVDEQPPSSLHMKVDIKGKSGFVNADAGMKISPGPDGGSVVDYDADAQVGGPVASVGQRMLAGISRRQVEQMMKCLDRGAEPRPGFWQRLSAWFRGVFRSGRRN